jgi:hypothetical protein
MVKLTEDECHKLIKTTGECIVTQRRKSIKCIKIKKKHLPLSYLKVCLHLPRQHLTTSFYLPSMSIAKPLITQSKNINN